MDYPLFILYFLSEMVEIYIINEKKIREGDVNIMADIHSISLGLKAFCTDFAIGVMNDIILACGGHGYSHFSG
ncbi:hypothetical protein RclHR1_02330014 [Rhizophagus clarus]|uniref:Acyl-CoA oxidase C-alpha1 domain-containing protein n=1 Tax=Rhizophagus clarus TaxID=94130 RepID=A0A2Z6RQ46_9GLOM|nr:hypothetical protein RclHR1_02330014 [Rhizophagus clarus]